MDFFFFEILRRSLSVLVTLNQPSKDYYIIASTPYTSSKLSVTGLLRYSNSGVPASGDLPPPPPEDLDWSLNQARSFRWNITANAARPNPQGSFHYGTITPTKSFVFSNVASLINGKQCYAVNGVSYVNSEMPLKLADHFNIPGVYSTNAIQSIPSSAPAIVATSVVRASLHDFLEVVFQNSEESMQSWHLDGYDLWVVGVPKLLDVGNLGVFGQSRNVEYEISDMGNTVFGTAVYLKVWDPVQSLANEYNPSDNLLLCGKAIGRRV
ncbi:SKU5 similar 17 [Raphanus sativus]|nr:SKU5 similar 17 [Raphanus sativus]